MTMRDAGANPDAEHDTPLPDVREGYTPEEIEQLLQDHHSADMAYEERADRQRALKYATKLTAGLLVSCSTPPNIWDPQTTEAIANRTLLIAKKFEEYLHG